jgi:hypothetical protein
MAASARTMSGSRFLRPKLSRFFNQVAQACQRISNFVKGAAAPMPPLPDVHSSRFYTQQPTPPPQAAIKPPAASHSIFLQPKMLSRFFNHAAQPRPRTSRFSEGKAALMPPMPDNFSSMFFKPRKPRTRPRPNWPPPGKPRGPGL